MIIITHEPRDAGRGLGGVFTVPPSPRGHVLAGIEALLTGKWRYETATTGFITLANQSEALPVA
jgi:hypothetical protein